MGKFSGAGGHDCRSVHERNVSEFAGAFNLFHDANFCGQRRKSVAVQHANQSMGNCHARTASRGARASSAGIGRHARVYWPAGGTTCANAGSAAHTATDCAHGAARFLADCDKSAISAAACAWPDSLDTAASFHFDAGVWHACSGGNVNAAIAATASAGYGGAQDSGARS